MRNFRQSPKPAVIPLHPIEYEADEQHKWDSLFEEIKPESYRVEPIETLSVPGDAPKDVLRIREDITNQQKTKKAAEEWTVYIAKVGSKWYPIESVTEQIFTRLGQALGFAMADSRLCIVGGQVRFLSRYFLQDGQESLVHGLEIFKEYVGPELADEVARQRNEREVYTFQIVCAAMQERFPEEFAELMRGFVSMLAFDALVGNNDRHPGNWGVIEPLRRNQPRRFAPIYDTARGLFWQNKNEYVSQCLKDPNQLQAYVRKSRPQIGWDGLTNAKRWTHFDLAKHICSEHPEWRELYENVTSSDIETSWRSLCETEFSYLSAARRDAIGRCLALRQKQLVEAIREDP